MTTTKKIAAIAMALALTTPLVAFAKPTLNSETLGAGETLNSTLALGGGDVRETAANIINVALGFLGIIAVVVVLIGGFKWMIAGGDEGKTKEARGWIVSGIIGLAIILSGWAITNFVIGQLVQATK